MPRPPHCFCMSMCPSLQDALFFISTGNPNKISLDFVDKVIGLAWNLSVLHDVTRDAAKGGFNKHNSAGHVE